MTSAFDDRLLQDKRRRTDRRARAAWLARRGGLWALALLATALLVVVIAGFAEAAALGDRPDAPAFVPPWDWLPLLAFGEPAVARVTGTVLTLAAGAWIGTGGVVLLRRLLSLNGPVTTPAGGVLTVARSVVDEAVRSKIVVVLLALLLLGLALYPYFSLGAVEQPLRYHVRSYLQYSGLLASLLLGGVTILFAAYSVAGDLDAKRTGDVFVKPVSRLGYLTGKWLGVTLLMAVFAATWGVTTWGATRLWVAQTPALDDADRSDVMARTLAARGESRPRPEVPLEQVVQTELNRIAEQDPDRFARRGAADLAYDLLNQERLAFLSVPFGRSKAYVFDGLGEVRARATAVEEDLRSRRDEVARLLREEANVAVRPEQVSLASVLPYADLLGFDATEVTMQLRFKVDGTSSFGATEELLDVRYGGEGGVTDRLRFVVDQPQVHDVPATYVDEDGTLTLEVANGPLDLSDEQRAAIEANANLRERATTLQFDPEVGPTVYYRRGGFAGNVAKAAIVLWVRLAFLAMLGGVMASLMSFPVAAVTSVAVWLLSAGGSWLQGVLGSRFNNTTTEAVDAAISDLLLPVVRGIAVLFGRYSQLDATGRVVGGLAIGWDDLLWHAFWIGVVWTGLLLAAGWLLFRRREIARVQV